MQGYKEIVYKIFDKGSLKENRTGIDTLAIAGTMFEHDMARGFPLLTTKYIPFSLVASELEFFIKGLTDKKWLQDRGNHIWDEWCNPQIVPYGHDEETKKKMAAERDLGPIYGKQWRRFGEGDDYTYPSDQLANVVDTLKTNPDDRRMIVSAWNPDEICKMALPPCHYGFQVTVINGKLNLMWNQRSVDVALGLPFNIASYGLLLTLLAKESGFEPGRLVGFLGDTHVYKNHVVGLREQMGRLALPLPNLVTENFTSIFKWKYTDTQVKGYQYHPPIKFDIAV